jgi:hypothetical protein
VSAFGIDGTDIVGFTIPGEAFCINCMDEDPDNEEQTPVFASDEGATELTCGECGETLLDSYAELPSGQLSDERLRELELAEQEAKEQELTAQEEADEARERERVAVLDDEISELEAMLAKLKVEKEKKS